MDKKEDLTKQCNGVRRRSFVLGSAAAVVTAGVLKAPAVLAQSGKIVIYSTTHPAIQEKLNAAFTKKTGIQVQSLRLNSSSLAQRFIAELQAGQNLSDVLTLGNDIFLNEQAEKGIIIDLSGESWYAGLQSFWRPSKAFVRTTASPGGIAYNPKMIDPAKVPKTWAALLAPEYKNNMIMTDPRANDSFVTFPLLLKEALGADYLRKLGKQDLELVAVTSQGVEEVIAGEKAICFPCNPGNLEKYIGKGIVELSQVDTPYWTSYFGSIPAKAPNPAGAKAYFQFLMSNEGQEILCKDVSVSPLGNLPGALPQPTGKLIDPPLTEALKQKDELLDLLNLPA